MFVPWEEACHYEWSGDEALVITRPARFATASRLTIPVLPGRRDQATEVLAAKQGGTV